MSMLIPTVGREAMLAYIVNKTAQSNLRLHLFTNNITPGAGDTVASYTQSSASGYSPISLTGASWTIATASGITTASYAQQTFTYTAGESLYGYYVTDAANSTLIGAELFTGSPWVIPSGGGTVSLTPSFTLGVC